VVRASDLDYNLPEELIAQEPLADRSASRLLWLSERGVQHRAFREITGILRSGDTLVFNNTKVSALRLYGTRETGGQVEALLFGTTGVPGQFRAMTKPAKKLRPGTKVLFEQGLVASILEDLGEGFKVLDFGESPDLDDRLRQTGLAPLPPYIHRKLEDHGRYQTVYAQVPGSAAAPTAGLHFTQELLGALDSMGVRRAEVTLDVSVDTFRPMAVDDPAQHVMHGERCSISQEAVEAINSAPGRIIAVGTTSVRTLESFAVGKKKVKPGELVSRIFIVPGYELQVVDGMFTNFHMPKTTMMLMISAMAGVDPILCAYREAVAERYRFLSFGDSMLILD
jgi:S-adenosylmethionine:tRNA ribosyltransferase-isomerase